MSLESGKIESVNEAWKKHLDFAAMTHTKVEALTITGDENSALAKIEECHFSDACRAMIQENHPHRGRKGRMHHRKN